MQRNSTEVKGEMNEQLSFLNLLSSNVKYKKKIQSERIIKRKKDTLYTNEASLITPEQRKLPMNSWE